MTQFYPIGTPGTPWTSTERKEWFEKQRIQRSYQEEVVPKIKALTDHFDVDTYGSLPIDPERYPLFYLKSANWKEGAPVVLITGGVHGYETSGVHGALLFLETEAARYEETFNLLVAPCVSPWGYEAIQRWNPQADDPNRSFAQDRLTPETRQLLDLIEPYHNDMVVHIDLHETTDSDEGEFRPAKAARDGEIFAPGIVPDGFYTVADKDRPELDFQRAVVESVKKVTHIAPADEDGALFGAKMELEGLIYYPMQELGLCGSITTAKFHTTTEVYPDSPKVTDDECNHAQVAAVVGGLDYVKQVL